jgi:hypothetical protein
VIAAIVLLGAVSLRAEERSITGTIDTIESGAIRVVADGEAVDVRIIAATQGDISSLRVGDRVAVRYTVADVNVAIEIRRL